MNDAEMAVRIAELVREEGGRAFFVGGYVRDRLLGRENKDIDIEVHGITPETLTRLLGTLGDRLWEELRRFRSAALRSGHRHAPLGACRRARTPGF